MNNETLPASLQQLVFLFKDALGKDERMTPKRAKELVLSANVQVNDLMPYADFDHPVEDCYGRQLVYHGGSFEVMVMSWNPRDYSSIHNHGYTEWGVVQVFGNTHHFMYQLKDNQLDFARREILPVGTAIKVNHALVHQMGNATSDPYLTLHVYGSNTMKGAITADAKNFDLEYDRIAHTCGGAFFNLSEEAIHEVETGVVPSTEVFLHYAYLLMDYYDRQPETEDVAEMKQHLLQKISDQVLEMEEV